MITYMQRICMCLVVYIRYTTVDKVEDDKESQAKKAKLEKDQEEDGSCCVHVINRCIQNLEKT